MKNGYLNLRAITFRNCINDFTGLEPELIPISKGN